MRKEYFDEVDENNELTGRVVSRGEAHKDNLWHRTAHVYFYKQTEQGIEFLVHKRAKLTPSSAGKWDPRFGGHIHSGESIKQGAAHEVAEEIGLHLKQQELLQGEIIKRPKPGNNEFNYVFYHEFNGDESKLKLDPEEVEAVKWVSEEDIRDGLQNHPESWSSSLEIFNQVTNYLKENIL